MIKITSIFQNSRSNWN